MTYKQAAQLRDQNGRASLDEVKHNLKEARNEAERITDRAARLGRDLLADEARTFQAHSNNISQLTDLFFDAQADQTRDRNEQKADIEQRNRDIEASRLISGLGTIGLMGAPEDRGTNRLGAWVTRALTGGSGSGAGFAPNEYSTIVFEYLRAKSVLMAAGAEVIQTTHRAMTFPRITAGATAAWVSEGGTITAADPTADTVTATPRKAAALTQISNELIFDSTPGILDSVGRDLVSQVALLMDLGFFEGTGTAPQPTGLKNVSGISTGTASGANGSTVTLDYVASGIAALQQANGSATAIVMNPKLWGTIAALKDTAGRYLSQATSTSISAQTQNQLFGVPVYLTSQLSQTETKGSSSITGSIYVLDAPQIKIVMRSDYANLEVDRSRLFNSDQTEIKVTMRADVVVPNAAGSVCRLSGLLV